ncbi:hypothetical protein B0I37DRAFT_395884 [Chaetomium sp. MPI-CAGE-AT-0009]|nr:hypothetical protein B0I37DRAFT_395884 [Chaetomium sp. MPI-CAGE-AT-0009]
MDADDQYFAFENRLNSFQGAQPVSKGKASTAGSRAPKALLWPHKTLSPLALAKAGFFFQPHPKSPDNVVCFLCEKSLDGWEETDNPLEEHLKHSPTCGWAIMAAIEAGYGNYGKVHPLDPAMIEARKATFAGRWPYESKKGFKCKTKKLVEGGWKFTPSTEADDMTTCAYCNLALEGWESDDNPFDEHYRRQPGCLFFALINQYPAPKKGRGKAARTSKASRLSVQSVATVATTASDLGSVGDVTADQDDSVMTTMSTATQGDKKTTKGRKAAAAKGRKPKAKKNDAVEILEDEPQEPPQLPAARGRKRASDAMEDHAATNAEAPAPKKRAARGRTSVAVDNSTIPDSEMADAAPTKQPAGKKKARASTSKTSRKASQASVRSEASTASLRAHMPDDDELERQLEADLERYDSNVEDVAVAQPPVPAKGRPKKATTTRKTSAQRNAGSESYAMFDPTPMVPDEAEIEADLEALQAEMEVEQSTEMKTLVVPKKGRKPGARKVSKQTKKAKEPSPQPGPAEEAPRHEPIQSPARETEQPVQEPEPEPELAEDPDVSTGTVVTKPPSRPTTEKRGRGRPSKKSTASLASAGEQEKRLSVGAMTQPQAQPETARPQESIPESKNTPVKILRKAVPLSSHGAAQTPDPMTTTPVRASKIIPAPPASASRMQQPPSTPRTRPTPSGRANQSTNFDARSPQTFDAENQPSALQPAASVVPRRPVLAPLSTAQTPQRSSPSKRNIVAGLQSSHPWQPADLDQLFSSPLSKSCDDSAGDKENSAAIARLLRKGAELTSPEKRMTVEEWIYHNAELAEQKLKYECEAMVAAFEREGGRALSVLEGLVVDAA